MKYSWIFLFFVFLRCPAQEITIAGYLTDAYSSEALVNGHVYVIGKPQQGTVTNTYGFFTLQIQPGEIQLGASYIGYIPFDETFYFTKDTILSIALESTKNIEEVTIVAKKNGGRQLGSINSITPAMIKYLPTLAGERDIIRAMQLLPGVQSATEGTTGLVVRGGSPDQNLFLIDGCPIYNISHLYGFLSIFNDDAIKSAEIIKAGFPAQYGDRLSSIINIHLKEGNLNNYEGSASVGLLSSRLSINGPIIKGKSSFILSARRSYLDLLTSIPQLLSKSSRNSPLSGYSLGDFNAKANYIFSPKDRIYLSFYYGKDAYKESNQEDGSRDSVRNESLNSLSWGNAVFSFRWNHLFRDRLFCNTQVSYTQYHLSGLSKYLEESLLNPENQRWGYTYNYLSKISDYSSKVDFNYGLNPNHLMKFGLHMGINIFEPGVESYMFVVNQSRSDTTSLTQPFQSESGAVYFEDRISFPSGFYLSPGIRMGLIKSFSNMYYSFEPRISGGYQWPNNTNISFSYSKIQQPIHLLSNSGLGMPTDLWVPSTDKVPPQKAQQFSLGLDVPIGLFDVGVEGYYKKLNNLIAYSEGASFLIAGNDWENRIETNGKGQAYGVEVFIRKDVGKLKGWLGYTLSWSKRQFDNINNGKWFFDKYDRRHDLSLNISYQPKSNVSFSCSWVFSSGNPVTLPEVIYPYIHYPIGLNDFNYNDITSSENLFEFVTEISRRRGELIYYGERNKYRMPDYHRLDLTVNFTKQKKNYERLWSFGLYNVYSRRNPFYVTYTDDTSGAWPTKNSAGLKIVTLLPILPSISYSIKF